MRFSQDGTHVVDINRQTLANVEKLTRPKLAMFGNSLVARSQIGDTVANCWSAWGHLHWIRALSNCAFTYAASTATDWGAQSNPGGAETIDSYGIYGWGGATNSLSGTYSMLKHLPDVLTKFTETPDIVYLAAMFENDITEGIAYATIIKDGIKTIQLIRAKWPNAVIIVACPGPSTGIDTAAEHTAHDMVSEWVLSLPETYPNLLVESNQALTIQSGYFDQPIAQYTSDNIIHQNERGAVVRAKAFLNELGFLFQVPFEIPTSPYNSDVKKLVFQANPDFSIYGAPGMNDGQAAGVVLAHTYTSYDWYCDTNFGVTVTDNAAGGVNVTLTRSGTVTNGDKCSATSDASATTVVATDTYAAYAKIEILNPENLFGVNLIVDYSGGTEKNSYGLFWQSAFKTAYPQGISDLLEAGDTLTLMTPPLVPGTGNVTCAYTQTQILGCATMPAGAITSSNPSMRIIAQNVVAV